MKKVLIIVAVIAIPLVLGMTIQKEFVVERSIKIERNNNKVYDYITHLQNRPNYSWWNHQDPDMGVEIEGEDGTVGFIVKWNSDHPQVGVGEQEITLLEPGKRFESVIRFTEPFEAQSDAYFVFEAIDNKSTNVLWGCKGSMP